MLFDGRAGRPARVPAGHARAHGDVGAALVRAAHDRLARRLGRRPVSSWTTSRASTSTTASSPSGFAQIGARAALDTPDDGLAAANAEWQRRRDETLRQLDGLPRVRPAGAWSLLLDSPRSASTGDVSARLLEQKVAATPDDGMGRRGGRPPHPLRLLERAGRTPRVARRACSGRARRRAVSRRRSPRLFQGRRRPEAGSPSHGRREVAPSVVSAANRAWPPRAVESAAQQASWTIAQQRTLAPPRKPAASRQTRTDGTSAPQRRAPARGVDQGLRHRRGRERADTGGRDRRRRQHGLARREEPVWNRSSSCLPETRSASRMNSGVVTLPAFAAPSAGGGGRSRRRRSAAAARAGSSRRGGRPGRRTAAGPGIADRQAQNGSSAGMPA